MRIINLTQHPSTPEQRAAGVFDMEGDKLAKLKRYLTFDNPPSENEIYSRAATIALLAVGNKPCPDAAMIGGALWLMAPLARELRVQGITPLFAFSVRETEEQVQPDGSVRKTAVFRHAGFVPAVK